MTGTARRAGGAGTARARRAAAGVPAAASPAPRDGLLGTGRLLGVDAARGLALVGMMAVHVLPTTAPDGGATTAEAVAGGRSAALFAVLAGVGVALLTGGRRPPATTRAHLGGAAGLVVRGLLVTLVGLALVELDPPVAVVLPYYGLLFVLAGPLLRLPARALAVGAAVWAVLGPVLGHLLRQRTGPGPGPQPGLDALAEPVALLTTLLVTGYYPVLAWLAYLLAGMAVGRSDLASRATAVRLVVGGVALAVGARAASGLLLGPLGGLQRLQASLGEVGYAPGLARSPDLATALEGTLYGTTPTTSWWWLAVASPHSSTPLDLAHTIGTSAAVIGACLLLGRALRVLLVVLAGAGSATLTLYAAHVVALALGLGPVGDPPLLWLLHVTCALLLGTALLAAGVRGPLEAGVRAASRTVARAVGGRVSHR